MEYSMELSGGKQLSKQLIATVVAALALTGCVSTERSDYPKASPKTAKTNYQSKIVKNCDITSIFSQNRFQPYGTAVRTGPSTTAPFEADKSKLFAPNQVINVDGWEHTGVVAYPTNDPPIRNDIWFHVAYTSDSVDQGDWVSFAGVRGEPTGHDTRLNPHDLGKLAILKPECEIKR